MRSLYVGLFTASYFLSSVYFGNFHWRVFICFAWVYAPQISTENWTRALWNHFALQQFTAPAAWYQKQKAQFKMIMKRLLSYGDEKCAVWLASRKSVHVTRGVEMDLLSHGCLQPCSAPLRQTNEQSALKMVNKCLINCPLISTF